MGSALSELIQLGQAKDSGLDPLILAHQNHRYVPQGKPWTQDSVASHGESNQVNSCPETTCRGIQFIQTISKKPDYFIANVPWAQIQLFFSTWHDQLLDFVKDTANFR